MTMECSVCAGIVVAVCFLKASLHVAASLTSLDAIDAKAVLLILA
jgi:hypothetical protein